MRPVLAVMLGFAALDLFGAGIILAAPSPFKDMPSIRPHHPVDAKPPNERCIQATTVQRFMIKPDGKMRSLGGYTLWVKC
jgi:hypothetical protein